jgi:hypothetical protein
MLQRARGTSVVEEAGCVELATVLADVGVDDMLIPVVCSWALLNDDPLASSIRYATSCCLLRRFAIATVGDSFASERWL